MHFKLSTSDSGITVLLPQTDVTVANLGYAL